MQRVCVAPPIRKDLDPQIEVHATANQHFDLLACRATDRFDTLAARADENLLLSISFDVEHRTNVHRRLRFPKLLDLAGDAVRDFVVELLEGGFATELTHEEANCLRADLILGIEERTFE